jgi:hypothetical protein
VVAGEAAVGIEPEGFMRAYNSNRDAANALAIEASPIGAAVLGLMDGVAEWHGTSKELLIELASDRHSDLEMRRRHDWPRTPHKLANTLRRLAPNLRKLGIEVTFQDERTNRGRVIVLMRVGLGSSPSSPGAKDGGGPAAGPGDDTQDRAA